MILGLILILVIISITLCGSWFYFLRGEMLHKIETLQIQNHILQQKYDFLEKKVGLITEISNQNHQETANSLIGGDILLTTIGLITMGLVLILIFYTSGSADNSTVLSEQFTKQSNVIITIVEQQSKVLAEQNLLLNQQILEQSNLGLKILTKINAELSTATIQNVSTLQCIETMDTVLSVAEKIIK